MNIALSPHLVAEHGRRTVRRSYLQHRGFGQHQVAGYDVEAAADEVQAVCTAVDSQDRIAGKAIHLIGGDPRHEQQPL